MGASPDGAVYDPLCDQPYGVLEVKCPYADRNVLTEEACSSQGFCCALTTTSAGEKQLSLRQNHIYCAQVQGQMAIGEC